MCKITKRRVETSPKFQSQFQSKRLAIPERRCYNFGIKWNLVLKDGNVIKKCAKGGESVADLGEFQSDDERRAAIYHRLKGPNELSAEIPRSHR